VVNGEGSGEMWVRSVGLERVSGDKGGIGRSEEYTAIYWAAIAQSV
jgi:hypothetical protein